MAVEAAGDDSGGEDGAGCQRIFEEQVGAAEGTVGSPRDEAEPLVALRRIDEEVVGIARVAVPVGGQHLRSPEAVEAFEVHLRFERRDELVVRGLGGGHQSLDGGAVGGRLIGLLLEGAVIGLAEVGEGSFVEPAVIVAEPEPEEGLPNRLHLGVDAEVAAVDRHVGVGAAGCRHAGGAKDLVGEAGAERGVVLLVVVQGEPLERVPALVVDVAVEVEQERGPVAVERAEEALLADADLREGVAIQRDRGLLPVVGGGFGCIEAVGAELIEPRAALRAKDVPVGFGQVDDDLQHAAALEDSGHLCGLVGAGIGGGIGCAASGAI